MAKKGKVKKTLVDQILDKAKIDHDSLNFNGLEGELPEGVARESIYKTLALKGDKTGPVIGIVPITEHLSEKKLAKISGNKKVQMIPQKDLQKTTGYVHGANNPVGIRQKQQISGRERGSGQNLGNRPAHRLYPKSYSQGTKKRLFH